MRLNRETIVRQALTIVQEDGLPALTLRRLAGRLGVQNPALYRHFASKQRLVDHGRHDAARCVSCGGGASA